MDREAIIHIGAPKTGSTSIQNVLKNRRNDILRQGAYVPRAPEARTGSSSHLFLTLSAEGDNPLLKESVWEGMSPRERIEQFRNDLATEMAQLPKRANRVIFSNERMSVALRTEKQVELIRDMLDPFFNRFTIVAYLRRQDTLLASQYTQLLRGGTVRSPRALLSGKIKLAFHDYNLLLTPWADVFGDAAIKARIYERGPSGSFDSVSDFLEVCGISLELTESDRNRTLNPSINLAGQKILREVSRILKKDGAEDIRNTVAWRAAKTAATRVLSGPGWVPTRAEAQQLMQRFEACNEAVRKRFCPERSTLFSTDYSNLPIAPVEVSSEECFEAACRILVEAFSVHAEIERQAELRARKAPPARQVNSVAAKRHKVKHPVFNRI